jgi:AcrR family transcriptional regulator
MNDARKSATAESTDPRIQRSVGALRTTLLELLVEKSFEQISITELTARAGLSYTTFFRHFDSKEALLNDVAAALIQDLFSLSVPVVSRAGSLESCRALCFYVDEKRDLWRALLIGGASDIVQAEFVRQARLWTPVATWKHAWLPVDLATLWSARGTIHILSWWLEQDCKLPVDEMALILDRLIVRALAMDYSGKNLRALSVKPRGKKVPTGEIA